MKHSKAKAFTLVEMLIVMGILVILMALGVGVGQFALERARRIEHQGALSDIEQAMTAYYSDNRAYPDPASLTNFSDLITDTSEGVGDSLRDWAGGSEATYYYWTNSSDTQYLVCVTLGGIDDATGNGALCAGDGFGNIPTTSITTAEIDSGDVATLLEAQADQGLTSDWNGDAWE